MTAPGKGLQPEWHWEQIDPDRTGASGDLSKMFKNEAMKAPGFLAADAPSDEAALLVREVIQNSWDAALESRATDSPRGGWNHSRSASSSRRS